MKHAACPEDLTEKESDLLHAFIDVIMVPSVLFVSTQPQLQWRRYTGGAGKQCLLGQSQSAGVPVRQHPLSRHPSETARPHASPTAGSVFPQVGHVCTSSLHLSLVVHQSISDLANCWLSVSAGRSCLYEFSSLVSCRPSKHIRPGRLLAQCFRR